MSREPGQNLSSSDREVIKAAVLLLKDAASDSNAPLSEIWPKVVTTMMRCVFFLVLERLPRRERSISEIGRLALDVYGPRPNFRHLAGAAEGRGRHDLEESLISFHSFRVMETSAQKFAKVWWGDTTVHGKNLFGGEEKGLFEFLELQSSGLSDWVLFQSLRLLSRWAQLERFPPEEESLHFALGCSSDIGNLLKSFSPRRTSIDRKVTLHQRAEIPLLPVDWDGEIHKLPQQIAFYERKRIPWSRLSEDQVFQEGYLGIWKAEQAYDWQRSSWPTWVIGGVRLAFRRMAANESRAGKKSACLVPIAHAFSRESSHSNGDPSQLCSYQEINSLVNDELISISKPRERCAVRSYLDGETLDSTGRQLGISRERVRQLRNRALVRLKRRLTIAFRAEVCAPVGARENCSRWIYSKQET